MSFEEEIEVALEAARRALDAIMAIYATDFEVALKGKNDPVTSADRAANAILVDAIHARFPNDAIVAEESPVPEDFAARRRCWFIDPLDGTKEFIAKNGEFCTMIGLAVDGRAAMGVVGVPALAAKGEAKPGFFLAGVVGEGARLVTSDRTTPLRIDDANRLEIVLVSRSHRSAALGRALDRLGGPKELVCGSVGVKIAKLLMGEADAYLAPGRCGKRWDVCAPEAIVRAAGGVFTDGRGLPFDYADAVIANEHGVAAAHASVHGRVVEALREDDDRRKSGARRA